MRYPWVNIALLVLLIVQLVSGFFGLIAGSPTFSWVLWLHGAGGCAVLALFAWKGRIILDVLRRRRRLDATRLAFLAFTTMTLAILLSGVIWATAGPQYVAGFSLITLHALLALVLIAFFAWHVLARRFIFRVPAARGRRAFLHLGSVSLGGLVAWQAVRTATALLDLPGAARRFTGSYETGSLSGAFPTVSWLFDAPSPIDRSRWRLSIEGAVRQPLNLTYEQVDRMAEDILRATIDCTGGWYSAQEWRGVNVARLLAMCGVLPEALSLTVESVSGYARRFSLEEAPGFLLATQVAGQPLDHGHGFPLRLVAPGQRGFNWVKWVVRIRVNETGHLWQPPLPLQ